MLCQNENYQKPEEDLRRWISVVRILIGIPVGMIAYDYQDYDIRKLSKMSLEELLNMTILEDSSDTGSPHDMSAGKTIITRDMIDQSGLNTIRDLLAFYSPTIHLIRTGHGMRITGLGNPPVFSRPVMVMINGFILNPSTFSPIDWGNSIGLGMIERIEIYDGMLHDMRSNPISGPVINLVLGADYPESRMEYSGCLGSDGRWQTGYIQKQAWSRGGLWLWGELSRAGSENRRFGSDQAWSLRSGLSGSIKIDPPFQDPDHNLGIQVKHRGLTLAVITGQTGCVPIFNSGGDYPGQFDYQPSELIWQNLEDDGSRFQHSHLMAQWEPLGGNNRIRWISRAYYQYMEFQSIYLDNPYRGNGFSVTDYDGTPIRFNADSLIRGSAFHLEESRTGLSSLGEYDYHFQCGYGTLQSGIEHRFVRPGWISWGRWANSPSSPRITLLSSLNQASDRNREDNFSGWIRLSHHCPRNLNLGLVVRYHATLGIPILDSSVADSNRYRRINSKSVNYQIEANFCPVRNLSFGLSYLRDHLDDQIGYPAEGVNLDPIDRITFRYQHPVMRNLIRFSVDYFKLKERFAFQFILFYQDYSRLMSIQIDDRWIDISPISMGSLDMAGIQHSVTYRNEWIQLQFQICRFWIIDYYAQAVDNHELMNRPSWGGTLSLNWLPFHPSDRFRINLNGRYIGSRYSPLLHHAFKNGINVCDLFSRLPAVFLINLGIRMDRWIGSKIWLEGRIFNLLNQDYQEGGSVIHPYPMPKRQFQISFGLHLL